MLYNVTYLQDLELGCGHFGGSSPIEPATVEPPWTEYRSPPWNKKKQNKTQKLTWDISVCLGQFCITHEVIFSDSFLYFINEPPLLVPSLCNPRKIVSVTLTVKKLLLVICMHGAWWEWITPCLSSGRMYIKCCTYQVWIEKSYFMWSNTGK